VVGHGAVEVEDMEQWEAVIWSTLQAGESYPGIPAVSDIPAARLKRRAEYNRFNDLRTSVHTAQKVQHHLHEFTTLTTPSREKRIERVESVHNAFPHLTVGLVNSDWEKMVEPTHPPRLFVSCSSDLWIQVDEGMIPGQIPMGLAKEFTSERYSNPAVGISGNQSVAEGWNALTM
jgi:ubiquitin carboxyl-terminal hydrolase 25/28